MVIGSSTIPLLTSQVSSNVNIDGFDVNAQPSFVVVDVVTLSPAALGTTVLGTVVSLEAGGSTLVIGTGRFALPTPMGAASSSVNVQAFTGGQTKGMALSLSLSDLQRFHWNACILNMVDDDGGIVSEIDTCIVTVIGSPLKRMFTREKITRTCALDGRRSTSPRACH